MPLYEYECDACGKRFERIQKYSDPLADVCPNCGKGPVRKLVSSPAIQFKGSGWYITDYARKDSGKDSGKSTGSSSSSGSSDASKSSSSGTSDSTEKSAPPAKTDAKSGT